MTGRLFFICGRILLQQTKQVYHGQKERAYHAEEKNLEKYL